MTKTKKRKIVEEVDVIPEDENPPLPAARDSDEPIAKKVSFLTLK